MSRDIVDISSSSDRLVVATRIEGETADQLTCVEVEDPDVSVGDEELDRLAFVSPADADVMELAVVAQCERSCGIDLVVADAEVGIGIGPSARRSGSGAARALLGLGGDEALSFEDPPDRRDRGHLIALAGEVGGIDSSLPESFDPSGQVSSKPGEDHLHYSTAPEQPQSSSG